MKLAREEWEVTSRIKAHTEFETLCCAERKVESTTTKVYRLGVKHHVELERVLGRN
jgi:hypothetical protein